MTKDRRESSDLEERLAEAQAQVEALQNTAADAEARAATAGAELKTVKQELSAANAQLLEVETARDGALAEAAQTRSELTEARGQLLEAAQKYRQARLAAAPEVPHELVPELESMAEIDREFEAAQRVVGELRQKMERELREQSQARVPPGAPARRQQDLSTLSTSEKIKVGLQQLAER